MRIGSGVAALVLLIGLPAGAAAQDLATRGDWRDLGHDVALTYAWDLGAQRASGPDWIVRMMSSPLHPGGGVEYTILEVRISCAARTYVIVRGQEFAADGRPVTSVQPSAEGSGGRDAMRPVDGTPAGVFLPFVCGEMDPPASQPPQEAAEMASAARGYVLSGTAEWERRGRPPRDRP